MWHSRPVRKNIRAFTNKEVLILLCVFGFLLWVNSSQYKFLNGYMKGQMAIFDSRIEFEVDNLRRQRGDLAVLMSKIAASEHLSSPSGTDAQPENKNGNGR